MRHDLLLVGGHVVDPVSGVDGRRDVAFASGRVAAVDTSIPRGTARDLDRRAPPRIVFNKKPLLGRQPVETEQQLVHLALSRFDFLRRPGERLDPFDELARGRRSRLGLCLFRVSFCVPLWHGWL